MIYFLLLSLSPIVLQKKYEAARLSSLPPLEKNVYIEDPQVKAMSVEEVEEFRYVELYSGFYAFVT